jgi:hypothetical protein
MCDEREKKTGGEREKSKEKRGVEKYPLASRLNRLRRET